MFSLEGAGRQAVLAAGIHQDLHDGGRSRVVGDTRAGADGLSHPRSHSARDRKSAQPFPDAVYRPLLDAVLRFPKVTLGVAAVVLGLTAIPVLQLGGEFMPPLDEGDLLYMPSALPGSRPRRRSAAAADGPADQDRTRGGARLRQSRACRHGDRPGAAGNVRDDDPVQAALASGASA